jgi:hypothetical protein
MPGITDILGGSVIEGVSKIIGLFKVDPTVAFQNRTEIEKIQLQIAADGAKAVQSEVQRQIDVNLAEAQSKNVFIAGWRPAVGWVCAAAFGYTYVTQPFLVFVAACFHRTDLLAQLPKLDMSGMMPVLLGMLGLGIMRSYDKNQGTGNGH